MKNIKFLMSIAESAAQMSSAVRLKVGGVITDHNLDIIAYAYNGTPRGMSNVCEHEEYRSSAEHPILVTNNNVIHCEANLIAHAARRGISVRDGSVFLTHSPCEQCAGLLYQAGVKNVYYKEPFRTWDQVKNMYFDYLKFIQL